MCIAFLNDPIVSSFSLIQIGYHSEGDIDEVQIGFCWFEFISRLLAGQHPSVWIGLSSELEYFIAAGLREDLPQRLARCLYGESRRSVANREYFNQLEGMRLVKIKKIFFEIICSFYVDFSKYIKTAS